MQEETEDSDTSQTTPSNPTDELEDSEHVEITTPFTQPDLLKTDTDESVSDKLTDVSENLGDDEEEEVLHSVPNTPHINIVNNTDTSDDDTGDSSRAKKKKGKFQLLADLNNVNARLEDEIKKSELLRHQLREETDAKERVESNLAQLTRKHEKQLKEEEELREHLHKKDQLCTTLQEKELHLVQELVNLKKELLQPRVAATNHIHDINNIVNEKITAQISELQCRYNTSQQLVEEKDAHVESLEKQVEMLEEKLEGLVKEKGVEQDTIRKVQDVSLNEARVQAQIQQMVEQVIANSQKKMKIKLLEDEVESLKDVMEQNKEKYTLKYNEAVKTLQEVQDAYGEMRDVVVEGYKDELAKLNERVRIAEEKSNEDIITGLRQELLEARLQQERAKQIHKDAMEVHGKNLSHSVLKVEELLRELRDVRCELDTEKERNTNTEKSQEVTHHKVLMEVDELQSQANTLNTTIQSQKGTILERDTFISELRHQLVREAEMLTKEHTEKENLQVEIEMMESIKRQNQRLEEEVEDANHKLKLRATKIKFLKKQVKELEEQKQRADGLMQVIPEMQKKIDELTNEKECMKNDILQKEAEEREDVRRADQEKRDVEERVQREKEEWEKSILGIGKCLQLHDGMPSDNSQFVRPNSAPLMKPRPPTSSKRHKNHNKTNGIRAPTLNPVFLNSYPEGRKASAKMRQHQEKIILSNQNRDNLFRCVSRPASYSTASLKHISDGKYLPNIPLKSKGNEFVPRVLVWGNEDGPGNKMVAVGDRVLTSLHTDCKDHGEVCKQQPGIVKFIGFVDGNDQDVYIGVRLEEEVGYTDGTIQGKRYFRSEPEKGAFVHLNDIVKVLHSQVPFATSFH